MYVNSKRQKMAPRRRTTVLETIEEHRLLETTEEHRLLETKTQRTKANKNLVVKRRPIRHCICTYNLRPESDQSEKEVEMLSGRSVPSESRGENTFIIDSMADANRNMLSPTLTPDSLESAHMYVPSATNTDCSPQSTSNHTPNSYRSQADNMYGSKVNGMYGSKVTIVSEVPRSPVKPTIALDQLLDYDNAARKVILRCSKYEEIGNPHARRSKTLKRISTPSKWNRLKSYANQDLQLTSSRKDKPNFMDKQISSIYNLYEKARFEKHLLSITKQTEQVASLSRRLALPKIRTEEKRRTPTHHTPGQYETLPKLPLPIPTVPIALPVPQHASALKLRPLA